MRVGGERVNAGRLETLGDQRVFGPITVEVPPAAVRLGWVLPDQERTDALAGVRRHRVRALEDGRTRREGIDVGRQRLGIAGVSQIAAQGVDGDEDDVEPLGQKIARRALHHDRGNLFHGRRHGVSPRAVFVDAVTGNVIGARIDARVAIVAVPPSEQGAESVVIAIGPRAQGRERELAERGPLLDGGGDFGSFPELHRRLVGKKHRRKPKTKGDQAVRTVERMRDEVGAQGDHQQHPRSTQIELRTLHDPPNAQPPPAPAGAPLQSPQRRDPEPQDQAPHEAMVRLEGPPSRRGHGAHAFGHCRAPAPGRPPRTPARLPPCWPRPR